MLALLLMLPCGAARADAQTLGPYLPAPGSHPATHVVIEYDPAFDAHNRRVQAALAEPSEALLAHLEQHRGDRRAPWHPDMGVSKKQHAHFADPINHFREVSRSPIQLVVDQSGEVVTLALEGESVRPQGFEIDTVNGVVTTPAGALEVRSVVDLDRASVPPGVHEGVLFNTSVPRMRETQSRESVLIGRLKDTDTGLVHYSFQDRSGTYRAYVTYPLGP